MRAGWLQDLQRTDVALIAARPLTARTNASKHQYSVREVQTLVGKQEETTHVA